jgi:CheY-like chemotaxis protein
VIPSEELLEVLLVDDELGTRELLEQFCRTRGLPVTTASDGRAAITAIERNPSRFTLVLTDINMPGADGFDVLRAARLANRGCYVVMITGYATLDSAVRAVREGAYDFLAKPFSIGQLDLMLARIRDRIALERENRDLRRRLSNGKAHASVLQSSVLPSPSWSPVPVAPPQAPPAQATQLRPAAAAVLVPVPPMAATDLGRRVGAMEDRLGRIEDLLRAAIADLRPAREEGELPRRDTLATR